MPVSRSLPWIDAAAGEPCRPLHDVGQLARVARPVVLQQLAFRVGRETQGRLPAARAGLNGAARQRQNVAAPLAQRRQPQRHHVEPVVEIGAEARGANFLGQIAVRGRDQPHVEADRAGAAQPFDFALLQDAQDLRLQPQIHLGDLIQQQVPPCACSNFPACAPSAPVKAPFS